MTCVIFAADIEETPCGPPLFALPAAAEESTGVGVIFFGTSPEVPAGVGVIFFGTSPEVPAGVRVIFFAAAEEA